MSQLNLSFSGAVLASFLMSAATGYASSAGLVTSTGTPMPALSTASRQVVMMCSNGYTVISEYTETVDADGYFTASTHTGDGLRVRLENKTLGLSDTPYSDRDYSDGSGRSEYIRFSPGRKHRNQAFTVLAPERGVLTNTFSYKIYRPSTGEVVDSGTFQADVAHDWLPERVTYHSAPVCDPFPPSPLPPAPLPPRPPRR